ncbi:M57 family metalloprotease [Pendulispora brunnea]|uniref:M57 family metalloprotease n=1 Tax=Pendulispora brunnea TaxID=2905690 RepID=A0ABZ2K0U4_9BACT
MIHVNTKLSRVSWVRAGTRPSGAAMFAAAIMLAGCTSESGAGEANTEVTDTTATSFEEWQKTVYRDPDSGTWVVDGDTPILDVAELHDFYETYVQQGALIIDMHNGTINKWDPQTALNLTYCVDRQSFGSAYNRVVQAAKDAGNAWANVARIRFVHEASEDDRCTSNNNGVLFNVLRRDDPRFLGYAFFPHMPRPQRQVSIHGAIAHNGASGVVTLTGLFRHELGHVLGFRHEHIHPAAKVPSCGETGAWKALTIYDSNSVMHYPHCNGSNRGDLRITPYDVQGAVSIYGKP